MISLSTALGLGVGLAVAAGAFVAGYRTGEPAGVRAGRAALAAEHRVAAEVQAENDRLLERSWAATTKGIRDAHIDRLRRDASAAAGLRAELDGLRSDIASRRAAAQASGAPAGTDGFTAREELLGRCAERYSDVAEVATDLAGRVRGLQAFIAGVCLTSVQP